MITYSAAGYWVETISGSSALSSEPGEYFPDMPPTTSSVRRNYVRSALIAIACTPLFLARQVARLVPASVIAGWTARAEARDLARHINRLNDLGPHFLRDIGIEQVSADGYAVIGTGESVAVDRPAEPAAVRFEAAPAKRSVKAAPQRAWRWGPADLAGAAMP